MQEKQKGGARDKNREGGKNFPVGAETFLILGTPLLRRVDDRFTQDPARFLSNGVS